MYEAKCLVMDYQHPTSNPMHQQHLHQIHSFGPSSDASTRWSQYQQLWRQHQMFINGKSCGKDSPEKKDENDLWCNVDAQAAFLTPNLWDNKQLPYDTDLKYCDLDEFLSDNGIPIESQPALGGAMVPTQQAKLESACLPPCQTAAAAVTAVASSVQAQQQSQQSLTNSIIPKREPSPDPSDSLSPLPLNPPSPADSTLSFASSSRDFDPRCRPFSDEELKPQPMVKKSRKQIGGLQNVSILDQQDIDESDLKFVPDGLKDEKYWARRRKNNMAAKRSRDARRLKENQIALRAGFLEKENMSLRQEMDRLKRENLALRDRLSKFTEI